MLLKYGANINKSLSAGKDKLTPLMLASAHGHLGVVRRLIDGGATVELLGMIMNIFVRVLHVDVNSYSLSLYFHCITYRCRLCMMCI